jgi:hypothetical protein
MRAALKEALPQTSQPKRWSAGRFGFLLILTSIVVITGVVLIYISQSKESALPSSGTRYEQPGINDISVRVRPLTVESAEDVRQKAAEDYEKQRKNDVGRSPNIVSSSSTDRMMYYVIFSTVR